VAKIKPLVLNLTKLGDWKYVRIASLLRTEKPAQKHILLTLALHADGKTGYCYPSYDELRDDTSYGSKQTISDAITYLRDELKILTWKQGHSNQYRNIANGYTLILPAMVTLLKAQRAQRKAKEEQANALSAESSKCTQRHSAESTEAVC